MIEAARLARTLCAPFSHEGTMLLHIGRRMISGSTNNKVAVSQALFTEKRLLRQHSRTQTPLLCDSLCASPSLLFSQYHQRRLFAIKRKRRQEEVKKPKISRLSNPVDEEITADMVRLVNGSEHRIVSKDMAIQLARQQGLNLVQFSQQSPPPCRIVDFSEMQRQHEEEAQKKAEEQAEVRKSQAKIKAVRVGWNIASHDLRVKERQAKEFLDKGKTVVVSVTYSCSPKTWKEQYPGAVQKAKEIWEGMKHFAHSWFDYNESGNTQVSIVYSSTMPAATGKKALLPWEPGSMLPPFLLQMQNDAKGKPSKQLKR